MLFTERYLITFIYAYFFTAVNALYRAQHTVLAQLSAHILKILSLAMFYWRTSIQIWNTNFHALKAFLRLV